jgi:surface antigen
MVFANPAFAQGAPDRNDPYGYYSQMDHEGFYDRDGNYVRNKDNQPRPNDDYDNAPPPQVYSESTYDEQCRKGNNAAGTLFGAIAGGLLGGAIGHHGGPHGGHTDAGAVVGGVILGGMAGNAMTRDMPCEDHPYAMRVYATGLNGEIGRRYDWRRGDDYGYFVPDREFRRSGYTCRSFNETTFVRGRKYTRSGSACRMNDGNWRFD